MWSVILCGVMSHDRRGDVTIDASWVDSDVLFGVFAAANSVLVEHPCVACAEWSGVWATMLWPEDVDFCGWWLAALPHVKCVCGEPVVRPASNCAWMLLVSICPVVVGHLHDVVLLLFDEFAPACDHVDCAVGRVS